MLEERGGAAALSGRSAVGILVVQDLAAVALLAVTHEDLPSPWAAALVPGYALFEAVGPKDDLDALVVGVLLAPHPGSLHLSKSLFSVKELLLIGFFLSVGFTVLLWTRGLRRRTSVRRATMLGNFSEFGLIVAVAAESGLGEEWLGVVATAVAASFVLPFPVSRGPDAFVQLTRRFLPERPIDRLHAEDRPIDVGDAEAVVLGMGRVGRAAYVRLQDDYGLRVVGVEDLPPREEALKAD